MNWMSLILPLLNIGSSLIGTFTGNQDNKQTTTNTNSTTGSTQSDMTDAITQLMSTVTDKQNTSQNTTQTGNNIGQTNRLDAATSSLLTQQVQSLLKSSQTGTNDITQQLNEANGPNNAFDSNSYVSGIMKAATANAMSGQESTLNSIDAATGGNANTNSAASLLANKEHNQVADNLAGIQAQATGDAQSILAQRASTTEGLSGALQSNVSNLLGLLENSKETTTNNNTSDQKTNQVTNSTQKTNQNQKTNQKTSAVAAQNTTQIATGDSKDQTHNWEDFFNNISKAFGSNFHMPTS